MVSRIAPRLSIILQVEHGVMLMTVGKVAVREIPVRNLWIANFRFFFCEMYVQNQWGHKTLRFKWITATLAVEVRLPLVRIEYAFAFQI